MQHVTDLKSMFRDPFGVALLIYYLLMAIVGALIPDDIMIYPRAREFSNYMAEIVPQIERVTALNIKPDVNRFYFSVQWLFSPIFLFGVFGLIVHGKSRGTASMWSAPLRKSIPLMLFGVFAAVFFVQFDLMVDPGMRLTRFTFEVWFGRAVLSQIFVLGPIFFGLGVLVWLVGWITGVIPKNIKMECEKNAR